MIEPRYITRFLLLLWTVANYVLLAVQTVGTANPVVFVIDFVALCYLVCILYNHK